MLCNDSEEDKNIRSWCGEDKGIDYVKMETVTLIGKGG
jgi:hypothetical protein